MRLFIEAEIDPYQRRTVVASIDPGRTLELRRHQVPVWLSFLPRRLTEACLDQVPPAEAVFLGAVFDGGYGHTLCLSDRHLKLPETTLHECLDRTNTLKLGFADGRQAAVPRLYGDLWIHSNLENVETGRPLTLNLELALLGVAYYDDQSAAAEPSGNGVRVSGPRVPLLGTAALGQAGIDVCLIYSDFARLLGRARARFYVPDVQTT